MGINISTHGKRNLKEENKKEKNVYSNTQEIFYYPPKTRQNGGRAARRSRPPWSQCP
jgi:hypothetical protein